MGCYETTKMRTSFIIPYYFSCTAGLEKYTGPVQWSSLYTFYLCADSCDGEMDPVLLESDEEDFK